jgi:hypothetical protein
VLFHKHFIILLCDLVVFVVEFHAWIRLLGRTEAPHAFTQPKTIWSVKKAVMVNRNWAYPPRRWFHLVGYLVFISVSPTLQPDVKEVS